MLVPAGVADRQQAPASYNMTDRHSGLKTNASFDTNYYADHNPDRTAARHDPLLHYVEYGQNEGHTAFEA